MPAADERTGLPRAITMLPSKHGLMHDEAYRIVHRHFNVEYIEKIPRGKSAEAVKYILAGELCRTLNGHEAAVFLPYLPTNATNSISNQRHLPNVGAN